MSYLEDAERFLKEETQFHLGFLPTEQSNPLSATLEEDFRRDTASGVRTLQRVDREVAAAAKNIFRSDAYAKLTDCMEKTLRNGGRVIFSGCGATGRLSILLESFWRTRCRDFASRCPEAAKFRNSVSSIMTGGDYALVKAVEFFEDSQAFGRRQCAELGVSASDMLVAITEGGETSSVLGTLFEAAERKAKCFLLFNNPAELLSDRLERSRRAICDPKITVLDLFCGPMALAGSTRMQATTMEQLVAGSALESVFRKLTKTDETRDPAADFERLLDALEDEDSAEAIGSMIDFEADTYASGGKITYFCDRYMLDIFTDTAERTPTFLLTPFRAAGDAGAEESWAFVKNPLYPTPECWQKRLDRELRCLDWNREELLKMDAPDSILRNVPKIGARELLRFEIGNEAAPGRCDGPLDTALLVSSPGEDRLDAAFCRRTSDWPRRKTLRFGEAGGEADWAMRLPGVFDLAKKRLFPDMISHLAVKLVFNTLSTGTMVKLGRVSGNWMSYVALTNKKLIDRGIRLLAELGRMDYAEACELVFKTREELEAKGDHSTPVVRYALEKARKNPAR